MMIQYFYRTQSLDMDRVVNPLENDFVNELKFEVSPPYTLVIHGLPARAASTEFFSLRLKLGSTKKFNLRV